MKGNIDLTDVLKIGWDRLQIYFIHKDALEAILSGKARITNLPEGAKIYKMLLYRPDDCDNVLAIWYTHESFPEVPMGNIIYQTWATVVPIE